MRQMAGQCGGERAPGAMRGIRALALRLENFRFPAALSRKAEEIDRFLQVAAGDDYVGGTQIVQAIRRHAHLSEIGNRHPG
jgi:hypothetical protein